MWASFMSAEENGVWHHLDTLLKWSICYYRKLLQYTSTEYAKLGKNILVFITYLYMTLQSCNGPLENCLVMFQRMSLKIWTSVCWIKLNRTASLWTIITFFIWKIWQYISINFCSNSFFAHPCPGLLSCCYACIKYIKNCHNCKLSVQWSQSE